MTASVPLLLREMERLGRMNYRAGERKVLAQAAVRIAAVISLILFIVFGNVENEQIWFAVLYLIPIEVFLFLTSLSVFDSLGTILERWFVVPMMKRMGRGV
ncbi:MAG: hypothetical protein OXC27_13670 [Caldilineaceae bacterium]|nr:hypothetical protein [Caldilineaceae bacterium]